MKSIKFSVSLSHQSFKTCKIQEIDIEKARNGDIDNYKINCENYGIVFLGIKIYLITELKENYKIIGNPSGIFLLDKTLGRVACYWTGSQYYNNWKQLSYYGFKNNNQLNWLEFSFKDPIDKIITKHERFFIFLNRKGNVYFFGHFHEGSIGLIPLKLFGNERIKHVACGSAHVLFVTENNNLYGTGITQEIIKNPLGIDLSRKFKFSNDKFNIVKCNSPILKGKNIKQVDASNFCTFILTEDKELYSTGGGFEKDFKKLNNGFIKIKDNVERVITGSYSVAIQTLTKEMNVEYYIFGSNKENQFGNIDNNLMSNNIIYGTNVKLNTFDINNIKQLECGGGFTMIVSKDNKVFLSGNFDGFNNHNYLKKSSDFTMIDLGKLIKNWNERENMELKVNVGTGFIVIQSDDKKYKFNFTESHFKLCDISFRFNDF
ncbi:hypothetical protein ABK040_012230 [Willaertia magna]